MLFFIILISSLDNFTSKSGLNAETNNSTASFSIKIATEIATIGSR